MEINGIKTCEPIECLVGYLKEHDFLITEQRIEDSHFNELYIKMTGYYFQELMTPSALAIKSSNFSS